jgi:hypothetical protein
MVFMYVLTDSGSVLKVKPAPAPNFATGLSFPSKVSLRVCKRWFLESATNKRPESGCNAKPVWGITLEEEEEVVVTES